MKRIKLFALMALALCCLLCGCQFARESAGAENPDRLVGVSLRADIWGEPDGVDGDGNPYWNAPQDAPDDGEEPIGPYAFYIAQEEDGVGFRCDAWPGETRASINVTDEGTEYRVEATAYVCDERLFGENSYNSVMLSGIYQRPDGTLYAADGNGISGLIGGYTLTLSEETSLQNGGEGKKDRVEIVAHIERTDRLVAARGLAFDSAHALLSETELDLSLDEIRVDAPFGAAYLLLEREIVDADGAPGVARQAADLPVDPDSAPFTLYVPGEDGFARLVEVRISQR